MPTPSSSTPWAAAPRSRPASGRRAVRFHGLLAMLLALSVVVLLVLADRLIDTWTDGHLFLAWVGLWLVVFAATALLDSWSQHRVRGPQRPTHLVARTHDAPGWDPQA